MGLFGEGRELSVKWAYHADFLIPGSFTYQGIHLLYGAHSGIGTAASRLHTEHYI
jgi:hypothetical protein